MAKKDDKHVIDRDVIDQRERRELIRPKIVNGEECFPCLFCQITFSAATYCVKHLLRRHGGDQLTQTDAQVLDEWMRTNTTYTTRKSAKAIHCKKRMQ